MDQLSTISPPSVRTASAGAGPAGRYAALWESGRPDLDAFLAEAGPLGSDDLAAVLRADQRGRWEAGERAPAEEFLRRLGERPEAEAAVDLVFQEYLLRERRGETPDPEEFAGRFPQYAAVLRDQINLHRALAHSEVTGTWDGGAATGAPPGVPNATIDAPPGTAPTLPPADAAPAAGPPEYEVLGTLGRGGMGVVYKARQVRLSRDVALKMVLAGAHATPEDRARFLAEAEAAAALSHPGVVQVYECGVHAGQPYLAMEYCHGGSLADRLRDTPLPPREAAALLAAVADAVQAAHDRGIVHRDLKPANVLLAAGGTPKVSDFGLAKRVEGGAGLTATGAVLGTPSYMAPEQAGGAKAVGPAADVYALGAVLYECLTGRPPFKAATAVETVLQALHQEPAAVRSLNPQVPADLETICHKCLQKEPHRRYASAAALADDLRRWLDGRPVAARPVGAGERLWRWGRRNPALAAALGALAVALLLGTAVSTALSIWALRSAGIAQGEARRADAAAAQEKERADAEAKAKDAERVAKRQAQRLLGLMAVDQGLREADEGRLPLALLWMAQPLLADADNLDGREMAQVHLANYRRHFQPRPPALAQFRFHPGAVTDGTFSPDGFRVVRAKDSEARVWDAATGQPLSRPFTHRDSVWFATFSPDGRRVLTDSGDGTARVWDVTTGRPLSPPLPHEVYERKTAEPITFSPDGSRVLTYGRSEARVWDVSPDGRPIDDLTKLVQLLSGHRIDDTGSAVPLSGAGLQRLWDELHGKYPADFTVRPEAARAWRQREIGDCLRDGDFRAAEFHYWWLVAEMAQAARPGR